MKTPTAPSSTPECDAVSGMWTANTTVTALGGPVSTPAFKSVRPSTQTEDWFACMMGADRATVKIFSKLWCTGFNDLRLKLALKSNRGVKNGDRTRSQWGCHCTERPTVAAHCALHYRIRAAPHQ